jgi:ATP-dependent DNA helicase RecG
MDVEATVARLRRQGSDDAAAEAKSSVGKLPKDVWNTVSAFANTDGGLILLGLNEAEGFAPATGFKAQPIIDALTAGMPVSPNNASPRVEPVPDHEIERVEVDGRQVVALRIEPLRSDQQAPCFVVDKALENGSFRRRDDQNEHLSTYAIYLLRHRNEYLRTDRQPVPQARVEDLDSQTVERLLSNISRAKSRAVDGTTSTIEALRRLNILDPDSVPTLAGLLAVGTYPQQFFPQLFVDITVHPGNAKSALSDGVRFLDRREADGAIPDMVAEAVSATLANLKTRRVVKGAVGQDVLEIPPEVLREAIANALVHRDYSPQAVGQQVAVDVYPNRVEISSPGGLWGGVTTENIDSGQSRSRNDALAKLLTRVPLPGGGVVVENQGSGVPLMLNAMQSAGLPRPEFTAAVDRVTVTLFRHGLLDEDTAQWLKVQGASGLTPHQQMALVLAEQSSVVTVGELRRQVGIDSDDARADLQQLAALGLLVELATDRYARPTPVLAPRPWSPTQLDILAAMSASEGPITVQDLNEKTGRPVGTLRTALRGLVEAKAVLPTAPPSSRLRAYRLGDHPSLFTLDLSELQ